MAVPIPDEGIKDLCGELHQIGLPEGEVKQIFAFLLAYSGAREYWSALAGELRPAYFSETHFHAAELVYQATHARFAETHKSTGNCGVLFQRWGRLREAIEWFQRSIAINPDYARSFHNLGFCLELMEEYESAAATYRKALALELHNAASWNGLGNCLWQQGQAELSLDAYRRGLKFEPGHGDSTFNLAARLAIRGEFQEAAVVAGALNTGRNDDTGIRYLLDCIRGKRVPELERGFFHTFPRATLVRWYIRPDNPAWPIRPIWDATVKLADNTNRARRPGAHRRYFFPIGAMTTRCTRGLNG